MPRTAREIAEALLEDEANDRWRDKWHVEVDDALTMARVIVQLARVVDKAEGDEE